MRHGRWRDTLLPRGRMTQGQHQAYPEGCGGVRRGLLIEPGSLGGDGGEAALTDWGKSIGLCHEVEVERDSCWSSELPP